MSTLTIYTTPGCPACHAAKLRMRAAELDFHEIDLATNAAALAYVKDELGYHEAPVTEYRSPDSQVQTWSGFRIDRIRQLAAQQDLTADPDTPASHSGPRDELDVPPNGLMGGRDALILGMSTEPPRRRHSPGLHVA